ncbi:DUF4169 family protein [uncultured Cohaesibacter sp.]|uniref:DUF4169 family protein n=1 Tax=uncultured Cohaesibacter sp. TaxID=1002546 RepID=UPI0029315D0B|nr:DUF4169 family protein [uncultured Cohaesibacter sp.]
MATIVNLRQARKARARAEKETKAESNRAKFGLTKAEKTKQRLEAKKLRDHLDQSRLTEKQDKTD